MQQKRHYVPDGNGGGGLVPFFYESEDHRGEDGSFERLAADEEMRGEYDPDERTAHSPDVCLVI